MILETILESSSLKKGIHYTTQGNLKDEHGNNLRPDVVLNLPEESRWSSTLKYRSRLMSIIAPVKEVTRKRP